MNSSPRNNTEVVEKALGLALSLGVTEWCVAAGARNAPLVTALTSGDHGRLWNFFDERSAGFFAMGRTMATGNPCGVVVTSGTAVAELLPAVIESHYSGHPLVVISADRPSRYRGSGAPQAIEQNGIFDPYLGWFTEIEANRVTDPSPDQMIGPIHLNVCLEEPAAGDGEKANLSNRSTQESAPEADALDLSEFDEWWSTPTETLIMAGALTPEEGALLPLLAERLGSAFWSEAISNVPPSPWRIPCAEKVFQDPANRPAKVIRLGGVPTCRFWRDLENLPEIEVLRVGTNTFPGLARPTVSLATPLSNLLDHLGEGKDSPSPSFLIQEGHRYAEKLRELLAQYPESEPGWIAALDQNIEGPLFLGNSLPIREWNLVAKEDQGTRLYHANRGANGIDGALSTFYGLSADTSGTAVVGDLTALYDLSAPWILPQLLEARRTVVVINNGGGKIFSHLPSLRKLEDRPRGIIENHHSHNLAGMATQWGISWEIWSARKAFSGNSLPEGLLEIVPNSHQNEAFWTAWGEAS